MFSDGIYQIGDGLLDIEEEHLKGLLVQDDINEIYDVEQTPFARGKFAAVRRAIHKNSGVHFAAKFLKRRRRAQSSDKEIKHEIAVLMLCSGAENIVKLNAVHESRSDTALLLELATGGELQTFLDNEECLSEAQARICMREVLKALQFLHNRSIAHLDLKPQNILLTGERIEDGLKLCDFGISRVVADGSNVREIVGTPDYVAPEVLQYEPLSLQTDIWSVGVLTYVLLSGFSPFGGDTKQETFLNISQCALTFPDKLFNGISSQAIDFMRRALRIKPNDRMTAPGCLEHIWLKDECSIDRQIFNNISKVTAVEKENGKTIDNEDDGEDDYDNDDADDDDGAVDERNSKQNGFKQYRMNGKMHYNGSSSGNHSSSLSTTKATSGNNVSHRSTTNGGGNCQQTKVMTTNGTSRFSVNGKSTTTMISAAATRATTTPITMQTSNNSHNNSKIGGSLLVAPRRHSSDSNKENHNFLTKKYQMATSTNGAIVISGGATATKKTITSTNSTMVMNVGAINGLSTSTSCIVTIPLSTSIVVNDVGGTVAVANGINDKSAANSICLFPDAPTTPKVIRKAPTSDTSPTSVKALVKKFQLENRNNGGIATATTNGVSSPPPLQSSSSSSSTSSAFSSSMLLKEAQHNNHQRILHHQQEQHQQHKHLSPSQSNGNSSRKLSTGMKSSGADKNNSQGSCNLLNKKYSNIHQHSHNSNNSSSSRRLSSAYYKNSTTNNKSPSSSQEDITSASATNSHQKLIASHSNPTSMTSCSSSSVCTNTSNSLPPSSTSAAATSASSSSTYKSTCVFCMTCSGPGCRHSGSTSAAAAIMINQKSAVQNSISLDKGIIC